MIRFYNKPNAGSTEQTEIKKGRAAKIYIGAFLILLVIFFAYASYKGRPLLLKEETSLPFPADPVVSKALHYASLAPNAHNAQMWHVQICPQKQALIVRPDKTRFLNHVDPHATESMISIGAFLEHLNRAFQAQGYGTKISISETQKNSGIAARVTYALISDKNPNEGIFETIIRRNTDKRAYETGEIPDSKLEALLKPYAPLLRYYPKGTPLFDYLALGTIEAMKRQSASLKKREELSGWLRFSDREARMKRDGLPAEQLGLRGIRKFIYYVFVNQKTANRDRFARQSVELTRKQVEHCSGFFILLGDAGEREKIKTGMTLSSFWLDATGLEIALHPISQMLEEEPFRTEIAQTLGADRPVRMILRAGMVKKYGINNRIRRNLSEFVFQGGDIE